ncbi:hypothetical protein, partial [Agrobacterium vitis]|uniref:hypothetical protein n=1 Tax=Agrobacterium vitis TaxID=373 RepID=UPI001AEF2B1D
MEDDPAVPKERFQGRNYTSLADELLAALAGPSWGCRPRRTRFEPGVFYAVAIAHFSASIVSRGDGRS